MRRYRQANGSSPIRIEEALLVPDFYPRFTSAAVCHCFRSESVSKDSSIRLAVLRTIRLATTPDIPAWC